MVELFAEKSKRLQLIITTHSPYFVNWQCILEGARLIRVFRDESQRSRVCTLSVESMNSLGSFLNDVNNPHVLGLNASEAVFLNDRVVLVEGQEDVICYQKAAAQIGENLEADFFGWGVGGAPKMALIARLLQDLGYTRVAGILDGDKEKELQELRSQFASFSFFGISAANVRDKKKDGKVIRGLCDTACSMHPGSTDEFTRLFRDIKGALAR